MTPATEPQEPITPAAAGGTAWRPDELGSIHDNAEKAAKVRAMFGAIARSYDLNNRVHSLWRDEAWRRSAVRMARVEPHEEILDIACGTGDLTHAFARRTRARRIVGADFTPEMLGLARHKLERLPAGVRERVTYTHADAMQLPFDDGSFDVVSIAFGIRNVQRPEAALRQFRRVLRPGGRLVILEFDRPRIAPVRWFNDFYAGTIMPRTATWISGDRSGAYRYLPRSVSSFMDRDRLADAMRHAGFAGIRQRSLTLGICVCSVGLAAEV